ncbi:MAG: hypothetical protein RKH07_14885 [Gammaproteobacteria bacterium]
MPTLKRLIKGQNIAFDTHQAGDAQEINWRDVHLEKRLHGKRGKVRFPLIGNQYPSSQGLNSNDYGRIVSEVRKVLRKNENLLQELAESVVDALKRFSNDEATYKDYIDSANRIAEYFDLDVADVVKAFGTRDNAITELRTYHLGSEDIGVIELIQNKDAVSLRKSRFKRQTLINMQKQ